jgi:hypothetical protein
MTRTLDFIRSVRVVWLGTNVRYFVPVRDLGTRA